MQHCFEVRARGILLFNARDRTNGPVARGLFCSFGIVKRILLVASAYAVYYVTTPPRHMPISLATLYAGLLAPSAPGAPPQVMTTRQVWDTCRNRR